MYNYWCTTMCRVVAICLIFIVRENLLQKRNITSTWKLHIKVTDKNKMVQSILPT